MSTESAQPLLSVILPTCNRPESLRLALEALHPDRQGFPKESYEVWVTDDSLQEDSRHLVETEFPDFHWTQGPRRGPSANRNHGARMSKGKWLAFCDDDCVPDGQWMQKMYQAFQDGARVVEGAIHPLGNPNQDWVECPVNTTGGRFWSANIGVERTLFESVGGFDENFVSAAFEDQDLFLRLKAKSQVAWEPEVKVLHPIRKLNLARRWKGLPLRMRMQAYFICKHRPWEANQGLLRIVLRAIWRQRRQAPIMLWRGSWRNLLWIGMVEMVVSPYLMWKALKEK